MYKISRVPPTKLNPHNTTKKKKKTLQSYCNVTKETSKFVF